MILFFIGYHLCSLSVSLLQDVNPSSEVSASQNDPLPRLITFPDCA